ncbi:MAG: lysophospholipid acyltransferase family protein [Pseudomonadota bacterium]
MLLRRTKLAHFLSFAPIYLFLKGAGVLPFRWRVIMGGAVISGIVRWIPSARNRVIANLDLIWPDKPRQEKLELCVGVGRQMGRTITEILYGEDFQDHHLELRASGPGLQLILDAQAEGKPAIMVSAHFGQWESVRVFLRKEHGINVGGIYRVNNNPYYDPYFLRGLEASGPMVAKSNEGYRKLLKMLKQGQVFAILADQLFYTGKRLPFLGQESLTTTSPAELAIRYGAPLVPAYGIRRDDEGYFDMIFEEPIPHGDPEEMMRAFNDSASRMIQKYPDQWLWLHRRWKA